MQQIAFPLGSSDAYDASEYIKSSSNSSAYKIISSWPTNWGLKHIQEPLSCKVQNLFEKPFLLESGRCNLGHYLSKKIMY